MTINQTNITTQNSFFSSKNSSEETTRLFLGSKYNQLCCQVKKYVMTRCKGKHTEELFMH